MKSGPDPEDDPVETYFIELRKARRANGIACFMTRPGGFICSFNGYTRKIFPLLAAANGINAHLKSILAELSKLTAQKGQSSLVQEIPEPTFQDRARHNCRWMIWRSRGS